MELSELLSSAASGSYEAAQTESDDSRSEGCSEETLNAVEGAILRTLRQHSLHSADRHSDKSKRLRGRLNNVRDEEQQSESTPPATKSSNPEDMELLATLLKRVQDLRKRPPQEILRPVRRHGREKKPSSSSEELRMALEAATTAAKAAAEAAEAAAVSVARNAEAVEFIVNSMKSSKKRRESKSAGEQKAIVKSNQRTHWILGVIAVTTIAWRFGVVKVVKRVTSKLKDPLGYIGGLIGNEDESPNEVQKPAEKANILDKLPHPHIGMPEFICNDSDHKTNGKETKAKETVEESKDKETSFLSKSAAAAEVKSKEVEEKSAFSFAKLLQIEPKKS